MGVITCQNVQHEGRTYHVALVPDQLSEPGDADCFTADDVSTWGSSWQFVTIVATGDEGHRASLSAVVYGKLAGIAEITLDTLMADDYYVPSLLRECRQAEEGTV